jgi:hypothetical protein
VYAYIHACIYAYMHTYILILYLHTNTPRMCLCIHTYIHTYIHTKTTREAKEPTHGDYVYMHTYMHTYTYAHACIHTYKTSQEAKQLTHGEHVHHTCLLVKLDMVKKDLDRRLFEHVREMVGYQVSKECRHVLG